MKDSYNRTIIVTFLLLYFVVLQNENRLPIIMYQFNWYYTSLY